MMLHQLSGVTGVLEGIGNDLLFRGWWDGWLLYKGPGIAGRLSYEYDMTG